MITSISPAGIARLQRYEACRLKPYPDSKGLPTIGWGHLIKGDEAFLTDPNGITQEQADTLFAQDLKVFVEGVTALLKVEVTQEQYDSITSFAFNCGLGALRKSTFLRLVNSRAPNDRIRSALEQWRFAGAEPVLLSRRQDEGKAWP